MSKMRVKKDDELFVEFNPPRTGRVAVVPEKKFNKITAKIIQSTSLTPSKKVTEEAHEMTPRAIVGKSDDS